MRRWLVVAVLAGALLVLFALDVSIGSVSIPLSDVFSVLLAGEDAPAYSTILLELRVPRAITAALCGMGLAVCGLQLQTLFGNPLAGPWAMGVTAGAQVGAAIVVVAAGSMPFIMNTLAFAADASLVTGAGLGALAIMAILLVISHRFSAMTLLVFGLMLQFVGAGAVSVITHFANEHNLKVFGSWNDGNYSQIDWDRLAVLAPLVIIGVVCAALFVKPLNALLLGEQYAASVGLNVRRSRVSILGAVVLTSGAITAYCGPVSFLDIISPHVARGLLQTSDHRWLMPTTLLVGGFLGVTGDLLVNLPLEFHFLHVNAVNALLGGPVVIWLILRGKIRQTGGR